MPLDRFCNFVWHMLTKGGDEKEVDKLKAKLWQPPRGVIVDDPRSPWNADNEKNALTGLKRAMGG